MTDVRPLMRCALHVHSTYSDGQFSLAELREVFLGAGVGVVCMADHDYAFTEEKVGVYVAECAALSDERLLFIPGLEFECTDRMHVLGYGVVALADSNDPQVTFRHIEAHHGVSVIAHPKDAHFEWIESFSVLPMGIEVWNSKYDGRYAPRSRTFALLSRLKPRRREMRAFYGQDLHWKTQFRALYTDLACAELSSRSVLDALGAGSFHGVKDEWTLPSDGVVASELLGRFDVLNERSNRLWQSLGRMKRMAGWFGSHLPPAIKAQLRRIF